MQTAIRCCVALAQSQPFLGAAQVRDIVASWRQISERLELCRGSSWGLTQGSVILEALLQWFTHLLIVNELTPTKRKGD